jgi:putative oxidoreductase
MLHETHTLLQVAGYVLVGSVFLSQGLGALPRERFAFHSGRLRDRGIPMPNFVLACGLAMMLGGGLMVILDIYAGIGGWLLLIFSIVATALFQNFWTIKDTAARRGKRGAFFNNMAIIGGIFLIISSS